jgi:predicted lipoprotein with Yx(FWY)xxD motif
VQWRVRQRVAAGGRDRRSTAGAGLDASKLSTLKRDDGATQIVFNGHPLYTFAGDATAGQAGGQGSGGTWFLVNAAGDKIAA